MAESTEPLWPCGAAILSDGGTYRYLLSRELTGGGKTLLWVMCNPSTATATDDDPTIRRCKSFTSKWKFDRIEVVNLFAFRTSDAKLLQREYSKGAPVVGPHNDRHIREAAARADRIVCAWGVKPWARHRIDQVLEMIVPRTPEAARTFALRVTATGFPEHPLYVPANRQLVRYPGRTL